MEPIRVAARAARDKQAVDVIGLKVKDICSFTEFFLIMSGSNIRQVQAISDEIELRLKREGLRPLHIEGYNQAEWVLMDYGDFVVHVFSKKARAYYDLERLWRAAPRADLGED